MVVIAYVGLIAFVVAWAPESVATIRRGRCDTGLSFLALMFLGSFSLMLYAGLRGDRVFFALNFLTTLGALINLFFKVFPASRADGDRNVIKYPVDCGMVKRYHGRL